MRRVSSESRLPAEQTSSTSIDLDWLIPFIGAFEKHHPPPDEKTHTNTHSNRPQQGHFPPTVKNCAKQTEEHAGGLAISGNFEPRLRLSTLLQLSRKNQEGLGRRRTLRNQERNGDFIQEEV